MGAATRPSAGTPVRVVRHRTEADPSTWRPAYSGRADQPEPGHSGPSSHVASHFLSTAPGSSRWFHRPPGARLVVVGQSCIVRVGNGARLLGEFMNRFGKFLGKRPSAAVHPPIPTMPVAREAILISNESRLEQRAEGVLYGARTSHVDAFGKLREAKQPIRMTRHEEHDREPQLLTEDDLRQAPHGRRHGDRRHGPTLATIAITRNGNLVS